MQDILELINARCGWDCFLKSFDGWNLALSSGTSAETASPLAIFSGVSFISCPTEFGHPLFRLASDLEQKTIGQMVPLYDETFVVAVEAETMAGLETQVFFFVVESVSLSDNTPNNFRSKTESKTES